MSSVTIPMYHYALLKGYLIGQNPPSEVMAALEALHMAAVQGPLRADALDAIQAVREAAERLMGMATASPSVEVSIAKPDLAEAIPTSEDIVLPPLTRRALEKATERENSTASSSQAQTDEAKIEVFLAAKAAEQCPSAHAGGDDHEVVVGPSEPKKRKEWSPEARAAAAERMRARQAAGLMGKRSTESPPVPVTDPQAGIQTRMPSAPESQPKANSKPLPAIDPTRLITVHNGYAGKREDGQLVDEDWPDIKARLAQGDSRRVIAGDYEVEPEDLDHFVASNERREAKQPPGEARAPLRHMTGGAS